VLSHNLDICDILPHLRHVNVYIVKFCKTRHKDETVALITQSHDRILEILHQRIDKTLERFQHLKLLDKNLGKQLLVWLN